MINYDNVLSDKIKKIKALRIRKFFDLASTVDNVISLGVGEPDFQTLGRSERPLLILWRKKE